MRNIRCFKTPFWQCLLLQAFICLLFLHNLMSSGVAGYPVCFLLKRKEKKGVKGSGKGNAAGKITVAKQSFSSTNIALRANSASLNHFPMVTCATFSRDLCHVTALAPIGRTESKAPMEARAPFGANQSAKGFRQRGRSVCVTGELRLDASETVSRRA